MLAGLPPAILRREEPRAPSPATVAQLALPTSSITGTVPQPADGRNLLGLLDEQWYGACIDDDCWGLQQQHQQRGVPTSPARPVAPPTRSPAPTKSTVALDVRKHSSSSDAALKSSGNTSSTTSSRQPQPASSGNEPSDSNASPAQAAQPAELGTWAGRRRVFLEAMLANEANSPQPIINEDAILDMQQAPAPAPRPAPMDDTAVVEAAWRYRFGRRWAAEQEKAFDPAYGREAGSMEAWDEALGYLAACPAEGLNLQVARTTSWDRGGALGVSLLSTGSNGLLGESARKESLLREPSSELLATKELVSIAQRARKLMTQQSQIDVEVTERLETAAHPSSGGAWVGHHVTTVDIDHWGRFKFVLLRLYEPSGTRHKLLVRGKNYASEPKLIAAVQQEADSARVQHVLPHVKVQHVGTGVMEWSKDRDRRLHIVQGSVVDARGLHGTTDVAQLAAGVVRAHLPLNYSITTVGRSGAL